MTRPEGSFPAPHQGWCEKCDYTIFAGEPVHWISWSAWVHTECPVVTPRPPEGRFYLAPGEAE